MVSARILNIIFHPYFNGQIVSTVFLRAASTMATVAEVCPVIGDFKFESPLWLGFELEQDASFTFPVGGQRS